MKKLQEKLNELGYNKITIRYNNCGLSHEDAYRIYVDLGVWKEEACFIFDKNGTIYWEMNTKVKLTQEQKNEIIGIVNSYDIPEYRDYYIRFGELPKSGKSKNFATGEFENGVSAFEARYDIGTNSFSICGNALVGAEIVGLLQGKVIYLLEGEEVGIGSDGEPLLKNVKIIKKLKYDKGLYYYAE